MKTNIKSATLFFICCFLLKSELKAQELKWFKNYGDNHSEEVGNDLILDNCGNLYTIGNFSTDLAMGSDTAKRLWKQVFVHF